MRRFLLLLAVAVAASFAGSVAQAQETEEKPILSFERLVVGVRTEYAFWSAGDAIESALPVNKEWGVGIPLSYNLVGEPGKGSFDLTGRVIYFVDSKVTQYAFGLNYQLPIFGGD